jgi:hypothetical protein
MGAGSPRNPTGIWVYSSLVFFWLDAERLVPLDEVVIGEVQPDRRLEVLALLGRPA